MSADRFDLHAIDRNYGATFRRFDVERAREALIVVTVSQWEEWDRPVTLTAEITPGPVVVEPYRGDLCRDGWHPFRGRRDGCPCGAYNAVGEHR